MSAFSRFISGAARSFGPIATSIAPAPAKPVVSKIVGEIAKGEEARKREEKLATMKKVREQNMSLQQFNQDSYLNLGNQNSGFGSGFGNFLTDAATNILNPLTNFASGVSNLFGRQTRPSSTVLQPALTTVTNVGAQESQSSGTNEAFIGGLPNIIGTASRLLRSPGGLSGAVGTAVGFGASMLDSTGRPLRITRKMKRLAQQSYQLAGMDIGGAMDIFAQLTGVNVDQRTFVMILTKRFRNDGPVITKAALRKTKTTIRRMKNMCDMYDSLRPRATARRRTTTMKRANTTLIKN
jgi:hypothetical protein